MKRLLLAFDPDQAGIQALLIRYSSQILENTLKSCQTPLGPLIIIRKKALVMGKFIIIYFSPRMLSISYQLRIIRQFNCFKIVLFLLRIMINVVNIYVVCITSVTKAMGFLSCNAMPVISFGILVNAISEVSTIVPIRPAQNQRVFQFNAIGIAQKICAIPHIRNKPSVYGSNSMGKLIGFNEGPIIIRCRMPAIIVVVVAMQNRT